MTFWELYKRLQGDKVPPKRLLSLDPGHTTGVAFFENGTLTDWKQIVTIEDDPKKIHGQFKENWWEVDSLMELYDPTVIICENYRVYQHKLDQHANSGVETLRLIGGVDYYADRHNVPIRYQMATEHKGFCTDKKLQQWDYWKPGMRHSRDAIRAGTYFLLFNKEELL